MTANRRIFLNIVATYGRSLYALVIGLIAGRWTLMSLGEVDYGLMGLVGGMAVFVSFLNSLMSQAVGRFYAYSVGEARANRIEGLESCRKWFNIAVTIHTVLPTILIAAGYPTGVWAIENFLTIPPERIHDCIWVWRFTCISCYVGMVSVPYSAMYSAKQEIAELTIYGVVATTCNFLFLCYMITHPGSWLVRYMAWTCLISTLPSLIIVSRALYAYEECKFVCEYLWEWNRVKQLLNFVAGRFVCAFGLMLEGEGRTILVNKYLGPIKNASMTIGSVLFAQAITLKGAMRGAFSPAITNAYGAGDYEGARELCLRMCKIGTLSILVFAAPLVSEADNVLTIWLKNPPDGAALLCVLLLVEQCISSMVDGHWMLVFANGKIAGFNASECLGYLVGFLVMWLLVVIGFDIASVGMGAIASNFLTLPAKLYYARTLGGLSVIRWAREVALPLLAVALVSVCGGMMIRYCFYPTFFRICISTIVCESIIFPFAWFVMFNDSEKKIIKSRMMRLIGKVFK